MTAEYTRVRQRGGRMEQASALLETEQRKLMKYEHHKNGDASETRVVKDEWTFIYVGYTLY